MSEKVDKAIADWNAKHEGLPDATVQPCAECPWVRTAVRGWLGPFRPGQWIKLAHSDEPIACHRTIREDGEWDGASQCAGVAIFRSNVFKSPRHPAVVTLPSDRDKVFSDNAEFLDHHTL